MNGVFFLLFPTIAEMLLSRLVDCVLKARIDKVNSSVRLRSNLEFKKKKRFSKLLESTFLFVEFYVSDLINCDLSVNLLKCREKV